MLRNGSRVHHNRTYQWTRTCLSHRKLFITVLDRDGWGGGWTIPHRSPPCLTSLHTVLRKEKIEVVGHRTFVSE